MSYLVLRVHAVRHPKSDRMGSTTGMLIRLFQRTEYEHVFPELVFQNGLRIGWNILGWFKRWKRIDPERALTYYEEIRTWEIYLNWEDAEKLRVYWDGLIDRSYGVGRMLLMPLWELTGWRWIARLAGVTCSGSIAMGLQQIGLWDESDAGMSDLVTLERQLTSPLAQRNES